MDILMDLDVFPKPLDRTRLYFVFNSRNYIKVVGYTRKLCIGVHGFFQGLYDVAGDGDKAVPDVVF